MGSDDVNYVTDPVLAVEESGGASAAKTTSSDGSGGIGCSGASIPSSLRHQGPVQNLKDKCGVMDVLMGPDNLIDNLINGTKAPLKEPEITSAASVRSGLADPTPVNSCGGGDGSEAPYPWSLSHEKHVLNLKNSLKRAFSLSVRREELAAIIDHQWFANVVAKLRVNLRLGKSELEIERGPIDLVDLRPLHLAVLMGDLEMVQKILGPTSTVQCPNLVLGFRKTRLKYPVLDLGIVCGESEIVDALLEKKFKVNTTDPDCAGSLQLAVLHAREGQMKKTSKIIQSLVKNGIDVNFKDKSRYSALYIAVAKKKIDIVKELLNCKDKMQLNEACEGGRSPIQIASEEGFKDIENELMKCDDVRRFVDEAYRDRQAYVDGANAILVGAALIASVTFASWLQPPYRH